MWAGFAGYCVLAGSRWLVDAAVPPPVPGMLRVGVHEVVLAVILTAWLAARRRAVAWRILAGIGVLAGVVLLLPDAVIEAGSGSVSGLTATLVFTLIPLVVVLVVAQQGAGFGPGDEARSLLGPALVGVFGAALLIPFAMPVSAAGRLWLAALVGSVVLAGLAAVRMHEALRGVPVVAAAAAASAVMAVVGLTLGHGDWGVLAALVADRRAMIFEGAVAVVVDGPLLLLGLWLLREMAPLGAVTRYPLVLLVTIGESYLLMHGRASWPMVVGAVMMAGSVAWLLRASVVQGRDLVSTSGR